MHETDAPPRRAPRTYLIFWAGIGAWLGYLIARADGWLR